ncbi:hypothetical protein Pst134EA_022439 [Puccinia striiformis f. sp. tritici]|uniref:hypothetical protein n=1 Tax=Puccinia striiformis f. sp. tritici TaxID=168172 RepID=UPI0020080034|nr:hypothetical protein Pst134EA_022439 [Puccinia striiformis f. sp. tritici]KAH9454950.1 hypothetical protein Pst134EA_022439 [Puccinia striiformis f. sp. tritici]KAI9621585.1 hypothetical protein H4Q26_015591 [Puccinia striiformis f. sp. tritici PST-130]
MPSLTTHNSAQALEIQDHPNNPPTSWPVSDHIKRRLLVINPGHSPPQAVKRLSNRCNFSGAISLFHSDSQIHSPITTRSNIPISIPTMNYNNYMDFNAGEAEESQRQGEPYQGIFFEETTVGGTPGNQAHPSDGAATSIPVPHLLP